MGGGISAWGQYYGHYFGRFGQIFYKTIRDFLESHCYT
jgi:hypothetical protein